MFFLFGLSIGSFLNVLIDRLPKGENVIGGRSKCDYCHKTLRWFELIPLLSYILQGGRCRRCHKHLSLQYPFVECVTGLVFMSMPSSSSPLWFVIISSMIVIVVADFKYQIIPDSMLIVLLAAFFGLRFPMPFYNLCVFISVGLLSGLFFYLLWVVTKGKGMGFGDVKLATVLGIILGFPSIVVALYVAFLTGAFYGVILMITRYAGMKSKVAFGPFLLLGGIIAYFFSNTVLHLFGFYI